MWQSLKEDRASASWLSSWSLAWLLLGCVVACYNVMLLMGKAAPIWDADGQAVAFQSLVADYARQWRLVSWNPWSEGGAPDYAEPQFGAMSPMAVAAGFVLGPTLWGYNVYWLLWQCLTGWGMLGLARSLGAQVWLGLACALAWVFSGVLMTDAQHMPYLIGYYSLPWVIWRLDVGLREGRYMPCVQAGALWGLSALSGYPGIVIMNGCFAGVWGLARLLSGGVSSQGKGGAAARSVLSLVLVACVGVVVLSPTYGSFLYETRGYSIRSGELARDFVLASGLHPGALSCFSSPYLPIVKGFNYDRLWVYTDVSGCGLYVSSVVVAMAGAGLWGAPRDRFRWCLVVMGVGALALCLSQALPFRGWLYDLFFPSRYFRLPVNFRVYAVFVLVVLGMLAGTQWAMGREALLKRLAMIGAGVGALAIAAFFAVVWSVKAHGDLLGWGIAHLLAAWVGGVALWVVLLKTRWSARAWAGPVCVLGFVLVDVAGARFLPNMIVQTTRAEAMEVWRKLDRAHDASLDLTEHGLNRVVVARIPDLPNCKNLMIKMASLTGYTAMTNPYLTGLSKDEQVAQMVVGPERLWFCREPVEAVLSTAEFEGFMARAREIGALPGVIHSRESMLNLKNSGVDVASGDPKAAPRSLEAPASVRVPMMVEKYGTDDLWIRVLCPEDGWLIVTDRWSRSWEAWVNGKPAEVLGGAFVFRAVKVSGGENFVKMQFLPMGMPWLLVISWLVLAVVGLQSAWVGIRGVVGQSQTAQEKVGRVEANQGES